MTEAENKTDELPVIPPPSMNCCHLRSKAMYVYTDGQEEDPEEEIDSSYFWCFHTMKSFGPDDSSVGRRECRNPSRSCYEPI